MNAQLTIFTPTFNRAETLKKLYFSLLRQTDKSFIWLVVDDGSEDNTKNIIDKWKRDGSIEISYHFQENKGKSQAHNLGVTLTTTEYFVCIDSDDYLLPDSIEQINKKIKSLESRFVGILGKKCYSDLNSITKFPSGNIKHGTLKKLYRYGLSGDTVLVYRTCLLKKYRFPYFVGEKFVPDNYLYDLLDQEGDLLLFDRNLCICEYRSDGMTNNINRVIYNNPNGYISYLINRIADDSGIYKYMNIVRLISVTVKNENINYNIVKNLNHILIYLLYPAGFILYIKRFSKLNRLR